MNTTENAWKRIYKRAPLQSYILYGDEEYVFKATTLNIGEGGIGLKNLPHLPSIASLPIMFSLIHYPLLSDAIKNRVDGGDISHLSSQIIRTQASLVRKSVQQSKMDKVFMTKFAMQFISMKTESQLIIKNYVVTMTHNIRYLLELFERSDPNAINIARFLGYTIDDDPNLVRACALHDYQSLESV